MMRIFGYMALVFFAFTCHARSPISMDNSAQWFEAFKQNANDEQLYRLLHAMPKGGDLHHHLSGSNFSEWWFELATNTSKNGGYTYYTRVKLNQCKQYGLNQFGGLSSLMYFHTIQASRYNTLKPCLQQEYKALESLTRDERNAWMDSIRLDKAHEGRQEFFETHWQRLGDLTRNPVITAEMMVLNMIAYQQENVLYLETQANAFGKIAPDGTPVSPQEVVQHYKQRLSQQDALDTDVTVRLQFALLRFLPNAEALLEDIAKFVNDNRDLYVGINMVGREDNDKGHPLRFLETFRKIRLRYPRIPLAIHAGEVDEPNYHVRDTLLLGADRIGHGLNLITDDETLLAMQHGQQLIEINLISNLLLEYVQTYDQHPFPEFLRMGVPVALSTDDRGMWDSTLTDEFFVAAKEFNLSWTEIVQMSRNSLQYAFIQSAEKRALMETFEARITAFEHMMTKQLKPNMPLPDTLLNMPIRNRQFICRRYSICLTD